MHSPEVRLTVRPAGPAALLGDVHAEASVGPGGVLTWRAWPPADGAAPCAPEAVFTLHPEDPAARAEQAYVGETPVLQTVWTQGGARVAVTDFLPLRLGPGGPEAEPSRPNRRVVRIVEGLSGTMTLRFTLAADPGGRRAELVQDPEGLLLVGASQALVFQTGGEVLLRPDGVAEGRFTIAQGHRQAFLLTWHGSEDPDVPPAAATEPEWDLDGTFDYWLAWARRCPFRGVQREAVVRRAALLRALGSAPAGGGLAAAAVLAAWGFETELEEALSRWAATSPPRYGEEEAWLLDVLAEGYATGLVAPFPWLPHARRLSQAAHALAGALGGTAAGAVPTDALVAGLWGAVRLAEDGLLPGNPETWRALLQGRLGALALPVGGAAWLDALGLDAGLVPASDEDPGALDGGEAVDTLAHLWAIRRTLRRGAYMQARRALDAVLLRDPWTSTPTAWTRTLWLAALIHLQDPPTPGRLVLPDDVGFD